jgi:hypothetical protein
MLPVGDGLNAPAGSAEVRVVCVPLRLWSRGIDTTVDVIISRTACLGPSPVHGISYFHTDAMVDVSILRTAEEAKRQLPLRYPLLRMMTM